MNAEQVTKDIITKRLARGQTPCCGSDYAVHGEELYCRNCNERVRNPNYGEPVRRKHPRQEFVDAMSVADEITDEEFAAAGFGPNPAAGDGELPWNVAMANRASEKDLPLSDRARRAARRQNGAQAGVDMHPDTKQAASEFEHVTGAAPVDVQARAISPVSVIDLPDGRRLEVSRWTAETAPVPIIAPPLSAGRKSATGTSHKSLTKH